MNISEFSLSLSKNEKRITIKKEVNQEKLPLEFERSRAIYSMKNI